MNFPILFCILMSIFSHVVLGDYSYKNPDEWVKTYPECGGSKQSPIDFGYDAVSKFLDVDCPVVDYYRYYDKPSSLSLTNDGHTLKLEGTWDKYPMVKLNNKLVEGTFRLYEIRLHWSQNANHSSEHLIEGIGWSLETHAVHLNNKYEDDNEALAAKDGVLIFARTYLETSDERLIGTTTGSFNDLEPYLAKVQEVGSSTRLPQFSLNQLELVYHDLFFVYEGSLTYPPCTENVMWLYVVPQAWVSDSMVETLRKTKLRNGDTNNIRPIQELGNREVTSLSCN